MKGIIWKNLEVLQKNEKITVKQQVHVQYTGQQPAHREKMYGERTSENILLQAADELSLDEVNCD